MKCCKCKKDLELGDGSEIIGRGVEKGKKEVDVRVNDVYVYQRLCSECQIKEG